MKTQIIKIDPGSLGADLKSENELTAAAETLKNGGLVVFPTETVYGLGADAVNPEAVKNIFAAKGRPSDNPLIVHISDLNMIRDLVKNPDIINRPDIKALVDSFWPGPLTIIFEKSDKVPAEVSAGLDTVGIRMPESLVARELIRRAGTGVAAPSANTSGRPSPTLARHVVEDLSGRVDIIIDSGPCRVGLESTVLDMTGPAPVILRPGGITREQIERALNKKVLCAGENTAPDLNLTGSDVPRAPGMKYKHYAPRGEIIIFHGKEENVAKAIKNRIIDAINANLVPGILATDQTLCYYENSNAISLGDRNRPETIGATLFKALRQFDSMGVDVIFAEAVSGEGIGAAIMNRLNKAAGYRIEKV